MRRGALLAALALAAAPALADEAPAPSPAKAADAHGFGDDQFARLMRNWPAGERRVPSLAAIYDATAPKNPAALAPAPSLSGGLATIPTGAPLAAVRLSSAYGMRVHPLLGGLRAHKGVDLAAAAGTPIRATADGVVRQAGWSGGYGLLVALDHGGRTETRYGHMSRLAVAPGQRVARDEVIGYVGSTGRSTGPHLHYEVLVNGRAVDPLAYMR